jgi:hypothetical protein
MTFDLILLTLTPQGATVNSYALALVNPDPKVLGLSKTPIAQHSFPTIEAITKFLSAHCSPAEVDISELRSRSNNEEWVLVMRVTKECAQKMGFEV